MNRNNEQVLDDELVTYLRQMGLPLLLARAAAWLTRSECWKHVYTLGADAARLHAALVPWFAQHGQGKLVRSEERHGVFEVKGVMLVDGHALGSRVPKLVLATVSIEPDDTDCARVTIDNCAKVGRFCSRGTQRLATTACKVVAEEIVKQLSALSSDAV